MNANQNSDIGGSFSGEITVESSDTIADIMISRIYQEQSDGTYQEVENVPSSELGYVLDDTKSTCTNNATPVWDKEEWSLKVTNLNTSGTECNLYFKEKAGNTMSEILAGYTQSTRTDFSTVLTTATTKQVYSAEDDLGTSLYFAGAPTDNWVLFGGYYWRIIRMNGDGSTRMIYAGESTETSGEDDQIGTSAYNSNYNDNAYVGYMYGTAGSSTYEATHANTNNSTIKGTLDTWYSNLSGVASYIDGNAGFCNDRQSSNSTSGTYGTTYGYGTNQTYYIAYNRLITNKAPSLKCTNKSADLFTTSGSSQGNGKLTYPIGLITADEVAYAGGVYNTSNSDYYLYTGQHYWILSPISLDAFNAALGFASVFRVNSDSRLFAANNVSDVLGVRPVINLKSSVGYEGSGTSTDPFIPVSV